MTRQEKKLRISRLISKARNLSGKSQEYMAKSLGVSKRSIQNWETGNLSIPFEMVLDWFIALDEQPSPYLKEYLYGVPKKNTKRSRNELVEEVKKYISEMTDHELECFDYVMSGIHGSSPSAYLQKTVADLQSPIGNRLSSVVLITTNYKNAAARGELTNPDAVQPDLDVLDNAVKMAASAYYKFKNSYVMQKEVE